MTDFIPQIQEIEHIKFKLTKEIFDNIQILTTTKIRSYNPFGQTSRKNAMNKYKKSIKHVIDPYYKIISNILLLKNIYKNTSESPVQGQIQIENLIGYHMIHERIDNNAVILTQFRLIYRVVDYWFNKYHDVKQCPVIGGGKGLGSLFISALLLSQSDAGNIVVKSLLPLKFAEPKNETTIQNELICLSNDVGLCFLLAASQTNSPERFGEMLALYKIKNDELIGSAKFSTNISNILTLPYGKIRKEISKKQDMTYGSINIIARQNPTNEIQLTETPTPVFSSIKTSFTSKISEGIFDSMPRSNLTEVSKTIIKYKHYFIDDALGDSRECLILPSELDQQYKKMLHHNFMIIMAEKHIANAVASNVHGTTQYDIGNYVTFPVSIDTHALIGVCVQVYKEGTSGDSEALYCIIESNMLAYMKAYESNSLFDYSKMLIYSPIMCQPRFFPENIKTQFQPGMVTFDDNPIGVFLEKYNKMNALRVGVPIPITTERYDNLPIYSKTLDPESFRVKIVEMYDNRMKAIKVLERAEKEKRAVEEIAKKMASLHNETNNAVDLISRPDLVAFLDENAKKLAQDDSSTSAKGIRRRKSIKKLKVKVKGRGKSKRRTKKGSF